MKPTSTEEDNKNINARLQGFSVVSGSNPL